MRRAVLLLLAVVLSGCPRGRPAGAPASDECFEKRDRLRTLAPRDLRARRALAELEARCNQRAELTTMDAVQRFQARDVEGGRALLDRAVALAERGSREFVRADELRKRLDSATAPVEREYEREAREAEVGSDWPAAREAYRAAIEAKKEFPGLRERLTFVEQKCIEEARRALAEGRSFEAARDLEGALGALDRVFEMLDDPQAPEYVEAERSQERLQVALEQQEDDGIDDEPLVDDEPMPDTGAAEAAEHRLDWAAARNAYRAMAEDDPDNAAIGEAWKRTQEECLVVARREIVMAKAYESAQNYPEAAKSLASALRCADSPHMPEYLEARKLLDSIRSQTLPSPSLLTLPSGRDELLRFGDARLQAQDWLTAREAFRRAAESAPGDADMAGRINSVEFQCLLYAKRNISEAKAYEAAYNYPEALKAIRVALLYADLPDSKEHQAARDIERRIQVSMAYP